MSESVTPNHGFPYRIEAKSRADGRWTLAAQCSSLDDGYNRLAEYQARAGQPIPGQRNARFYPFVRLVDAQRRPVGA